MYMVNVQFWKGGGYKTNCDSILKFGRFVSQLPKSKINFILIKAIVTEFVYVLFSLLITGVISFWGLFYSGSELYFQFAATFCLEY